MKFKTKARMVKAFGLFTYVMGIQIVGFNLGLYPAIGVGLAIVGFSTFLSICVIED